MKQLITKIVVLFAVLAAGVHIDKAISAKDAVYVEDGSIIFNGTVNTENVEKIKHLYFENLNKNINYLVLQSTGGDVVEGADLAKFVVDYDIPVYVANYCASACTFAFFKAKEKDMHKDAVISIHNVSLQATIEVSKYSSIDVQYITQSIAKNSVSMMLMYVDAGIPIPVLLKASNKFGSDAIDLKRNDLVSYNILPKHAVFE